MMDRVVSWMNALGLLGSRVSHLSMATALVAGLVLVVVRLPGLRRLILCLVIGVLVGVGGWVGVDLVWRPFAEGAGTRVWQAVAVMAGAIALLLVPAAVRRRHRVIRGAVALVATLVVVASMGLIVNLHFRAYNTLGDVVGTSVADVPLDETMRDQVIPHVAGTTVSSSWTPPADLPAHGTLSFADIPGDTSGFSARQAMIYLPPAYLSSTRPALPVVVLLAGQPGSPRDWQTGGHLQDTMDTWAAAHGGLAPVVVVADNLGSAISNPLCSDTSRGQVATYLATDVPAWITSHLQVDPDQTRWAIAGASNGATCSLQMVTRTPEVYRTFVALSPEFAPSLGDRTRTINLGFGGDAAAFAANNPADLMTQRSYPGVAGRFVVGDGDPWYRDASPQLADSARAAGMNVDVLVVPGGHSWQVWTVGLADELDWLGQRMELV